MNIAELKGEKTVKALARRLLEQSPKTRSKKSASEMEAALLRLNPQLSQIADLEKGTPIVVPGDFALAADESADPLSGNVSELLRESELVLKGLPRTLREIAARTEEQAERVQTWLQSPQARDILRRSPELKEVFSSAASAANNLRKEQAAVIAEEEKGLKGVHSALANFQKSSRA